MSTRTNTTDVSGEAAGISGQRGPETSQQIYERFLTDDERVNSSLMDLVDSAEFARLMIDRITRKREAILRRIELIERATQHRDEVAEDIEDLRQVVWNMGWKRYRLTKNTLPKHLLVN